MQFSKLILGVFGAVAFSGGALALCPPQVCPSEAVRQTTVAVPGIAFAQGAVDNQPILVVTPQTRLASAGDQPVYVFAAAASDDAPPPVWIGVRLTPVPEPLAAHVGADGLMIGNIVKGSPADLSGLERYDILLRFNGTSLSTIEDLVEAISASGPDRNATLTIIRGGRQTQVSIKPSARPAQTEMEYKYEEPEAAIRSMDVRGNRVRLGPNGEWIIEDLGPIILPDPLKELKRFDLKGWAPFTGKGGIAPKFNLDIQGLNNAFRWRTFLPDAASDAHVDIRMTIRDDGTVLSISRDADEKWRVERTDPDGNTTSAEYESLDALQQQDPEAYEAFMKHGGGAFSFRFMRPDPDDLPGIRKNFQDQIEQMIEDARRMADEAAQRARGAASQAHESIRRSQSRVQSGGPGGTSSESISVSINNGEISIVIEENGKRSEYQFDSVEALRRGDPDLYERVKSMLGDE